LQNFHCHVIQGVGAKEKEFGSLSGVYEMSLLVGDAVVENPIEWVVADIDLTFSSLGSPQDADSQYKPKPIIDHMFRLVAINTQLGNSYTVL